MLVVIGKGFEHTNEIWRLLEASRCSQWHMVLVGMLEEGHVLLSAKALKNSQEIEQFSVETAVALNGKGHWDCARIR